MFPTFELFGREFGTYGILVVLGGLACGFVGAWLAKKRFGIDVFDFVLIMLILGGCCYGIESHFGFTAHGNTINPGVNDVNRFPVQLVEAACNLLIFILILTLFRKALMKDKLIYVYMLIYPVVRFILEFLRGDEIRGFLFGLSTSQWISILLFVYALIRLGIWRFRKDKDPVQIA